MWVLIWRQLLVARHSWYVIATGFLEPVLYLFSIGIGVGHMVSGFTFHGHPIGYSEFVAPAMLATAAMNGAVMDATFNFFFKLKFAKLYDQQLATPMTTSTIARGELAWSQLRGGLYGIAFLVVMVCMGLVGSWWALLAVPAALLLAFGFAAVGMALTTYMRSWQDFEYVTLATMPMLLFSATFFPATAYPDWVRWIVDFTPLYRGVVLCRELTTGDLSWAALASVGYLLAFGLAGLAITRRRLDAMLLT
jgi:lipooligosaccharide transport system permease protein